MFKATLFTKSKVLKCVDRERVAIVKSPLPGHTGVFDVRNWPQCIILLLVTALGERNPRFGMYRVTMSPKLDTPID